MTPLVEEVKIKIEEQEQDEKTGKTQYVRMGTIKVDGKQIWDNRYMAAELQAADTTAEGKAKPKFDRTFFKGSSKKFYEGMLIRQIK